MEHVRSVLLSLRGGYFPGMSADILQDVKSWHAGWTGVFGTAGSEGLHSVDSKTALSPTPSGPLIWQDVMALYTWRYGCHSNAVSAWNKLLFICPRIKVLFKITPLMPSWLFFRPSLYGRLQLGSAADNCCRCLRFRRHAQTSRISLTSNVSNDNLLSEQCVTINTLLILDLLNC